MSIDVETTRADTVVTVPAARVIVTGVCDGLAELREAMAAQPDLVVPGWCETVDDAAGLLASAPTAVLHATRGDAVPEQELAAIRAHTAAPVILVASHGNGLVDAAVEAGFADVLVLPQTAEDVAVAVRRARAGSGERMHSLSDADTRVVTVFGPKGGTGKSALATTLAVALAGRGVRTLLVDLQLELGDAALVLGSDPEKTIYDLVMAPGELDSDKLVGYTTRHASGLDVLPAPLRPEDAELVTEDRLARVLDAARESYEAIVVDTPASFHGTLLATLDRTDVLLLVCALDMPTLKNVRVTLQTFDLLEFPAERISLVLNQVTPTRALKRSELETALGTRVRFEIPYDDAVPAAMSRGQALEGGGFARAVGQIAAELVPKRRQSRAGWKIETNETRRRWPAFRRA